MTASSDTEKRIKDLHASADLLRGTSWRRIRYFVEALDKAGGPEAIGDEGLRSEAEALCTVVRDVRAFEADANDLEWERRCVAAPHRSRRQPVRRAATAAPSAT